MRIAFLGTPGFAIESLKTCIEYGEVVSVITQPDRRRGRGKKVLHTPVKKEALKHNIEVFQPEKIKTEEGVNYLKSLDLDLMVVVAYGQILSKEILDIPKFGCINVHASLLPKLRGAAPINWAIVRGYEKSGVTTMQMDEGLDTGDMLHKSTVEIPKDMTAGALHDQLMMIGAKTLKKTLKAIEENTLEPVPQDHNASTYAPLINKKMACIDWDKKAVDIHNLVRGFNPWPVAYTTYQGKKMKVYKTSVIHEKSSKKPGSILRVDNDGLLVQGKDHCILIEEVQMPNKRRMPVKDFINGHQVNVGDVLGG